MASPAVSTPSSAGSPAAHNLAPAPPALAIKNMSNASNMAAFSPPSGLPTPTSMTRKEWIIPPRPKPGRKPATDTPPTKRKAQNRAAQRAFRERRAARVGELEEQLEETKEEQQQREAELRTKIIRLEAEVEKFNGELQSWRLRCDTLDKIAEYERREKENAQSELLYLRNGSRNTGTDAVPLPPRRNRHSERPTPAPQTEQRPQPSYTFEHDTSASGCGNCTATSRCACVEEAMELSASGCGNCSLETGCQCLEDSLNAESNTISQNDMKRSHSPPILGYADKRQRQSEPSTPLEVDFTTQFASRPTVSNIQPPVVHTRPPVESCGFCEEGTYCMCAEAAAAAANIDHDNRLAPLLNEVTPPPSDTDVDANQRKLPSLHPNQMHRPVSTTAPVNSCVNGPGSCQQCQSDPKAGLFCRSLAAIRGASSTDIEDAGCCGGNANGGGCCKTAPIMQPSQPPPTLSVADTYKTLSTHKNFDQASDELSSWLGRLHATPPVHEGRGRMEVEAASVMGVLKLFDRRFGRD